MDLPDAKLVPHLGWNAGLGEKSLPEALFVFSLPRTGSKYTLNEFVKALVYKPEMTPTEPLPPRAIGKGILGEVSATSVLSGRKMHKTLFCVQRTEHFVCIGLMEGPARPYTKYFKDTLIPSI